MRGTELLKARKLSRQSSVVHFFTRWTLPGSDEICRAVRIKWVSPRPRVNASGDDGSGERCCAPVRVWFYCAISGFILAVGRMDRSAEVVFCKDVQVQISREVCARGAPTAAPAGSR